MSTDYNDEWHDIAWTMSDITSVELQTQGDWWQNECDLTTPRALYWKTSQTKQPIKIPV